MTNREYNIERHKALKYAEHRRQQNEIREIKHSNDKKKLSFSKLMMTLGYIDIGIIQIFCMFTIIYLRDASSLYALIGLVATILGEIGIYNSYNKKSTAENTQGGIIFETAMKEQENQNDVG